MCSVGDRVALAWCHPGTVTGAFCDSVARLLIHDAGGDQFLTGEGGGTIGLRSGPRIAEGRNQVVRAFMKLKGPDWLWFVDSDMVFEPDALVRLMATADKAVRPIVGGLCYSGGMEDVGGYYEPEPVMFTVVDNQPARIVEWPEDSVVPVDATGAACLLIHWSVLYKMLEKFGTTDGRPNPYPWFVEGWCSTDGAPWGEDAAFCIKARSLGFPIVVDTSVRVGHVKQTIIKGPKRPTEGVAHG